MSATRYAVIKTADAHGVRKVIRRGGAWVDPMDKRQAYEPIGKTFASYVDAQTKRAELDGATDWWL